MVKSTLLFIVFLFSYLINFGQDRKDLNVDEMLRAHICAQSSIKDTQALGGYGRSSNYPHKIHNSLQFTETGFFLKIDTSVVVTYANDYNGYVLFIGNITDTLITLAASDSRLYVIAEVYYQDKWQAIEYIPRTWCGNSFHRVFLKPNEYWRFEIPKFAGNVQVKLRYRLAITTHQFVYSNEIQARINIGQLRQAETYKTNRLMDPYVD